MSNFIQSQWIMTKEAGTNSLHGNKISQCSAYITVDSLSSTPETTHLSPLFGGNVDCVKFELDKH